MKKIKNNPLTTGLALILIGMLLFMVNAGKISITEASGFLTIAAGLLLSDDDKFTENFFQGKPDKDKEPEL